MQPQSPKGNTAETASPAEKLKAKAPAGKPQNKKRRPGSKW